MSKIKISILPGVEKTLRIKNNYLHYEEKHKEIKADPMSINSSTFKSIKHEIIKENMISFIKHHMGADVEEIDEDEYERRLKTRKQEVEENPPSGLEGKQEKEIIGYTESDYPYDNPFILIKKDMMNIILEMVKEDRKNSSKRMGKTIKNLFIISKEMRQYYLELFLNHLRFYYTKDFESIKRHQFRHIKLLKNEENYNQIPHSVKTITIDKINFDISTLPDWIEELTLGNDFIQVIDKFPLSLKRLILGNNFNHKLNNLPKKLEYLKVGQSYNKKFYNIPKSLKTLIIESSDFNKKLDLSETNLETLNIGFLDFEKPLDKLPISLKNLTIESSEFNSPLDELPENLESLMIDSDLFKQPLDKLPSKLKNLHVATGKRIIQLDPPKSLETLFLVISKRFNLNIMYLNKLRVLTIDFFEFKIGEIDLENLPQNLKILNLIGNFNQKIDNLEDSIEILALGKFFKYEIKRLPKNIKRIQVWKGYFNLKKLREDYPNVMIIKHDGVPKIEY